ncbi:hypothetical protein BDR03DRAFT_1019025 [Suillus americanus]|nr:hypothetical protein BDR03DRAFT_1019025 [Suillus americanus]
MLVDRVYHALDPSSLEALSNGAVKELMKNKVEAELQEIGIGILEKFIGPHATFSSTGTAKEDHENALAI